MRILHVSSAKISAAANNILLICAMIGGRQTTSFREQKTIGAQNFLLPEEISSMSESDFDVSSC